MTGIAEQTSGTAILHEGRAVALKWHRLRRRLSDPLFGVETLRQGFQLGASMEIDLRVTADGDFVVLHDATLGRETNGTGEVAGMTREQLSGIRYDDTRLPGGEGSRRDLLFVDDVADLITAARPRALLQFDMKDEYAAIGERGMQCLEQLFAGKEVPIVVSGECLELIERIKHRLPNLGRGIDPSERLVPLLRERKLHELASLLVHEITGPTEPEIVYLAWPLVLAAEQQGIDLVAICHGEGKKVDAWTFNLSDPENGFSDREWADLRRLLELGVDQISTDEAIATERAYSARMATG